MKQCCGLLLVAACLTPAIHAQEDFWGNPSAYLGQTPPSDTPKIFAPGLLAGNGMFVMGRVAFSHDGQEFYYAQNDSWDSGAHSSMKMIRYAHHQWSKPVVLNQGFLSPTLSVDDKILYRSLPRREVRGLRLHASR